MGQEADIGPKNGRQVSEKRMRNELRGAAAVESQQVWGNVKQNEAMMSALLPIKESFDLICRELQIGEREAAFYFVDGMIKDEAMVKILGQLLGITKFMMILIRSCGMCSPGRSHYLSTDMKPVLCWIAVLIRLGVWRSPLRISRCAAPETALWRRSYLTRH